MLSKPNYIEFSDPRLVAIYNTVNGISEYQQFYLDLAKKLSSNLIIDVGCGSGLLTCKLSQQGHQMVGVEPSSAMLGLARQSACGQTVRWFHGDALSLGEFGADLVIMTGHVAQFHLEDDYWLTVLKKIHTALRPGGYLVFESRNPAVQPWFNTQNREHIDWPSRSTPKKVIDPVAGEVHWWMQLLEVEGNDIRYEIHYLFTQTDEELVSVNELRFRTREEIEHTLVSAGFIVESIYGNWDWSLATEESPEFIFVAKRK